MKILTIFVLCSLALSVTTSESLASTQRSTDKSAVFTWLKYKVVFNKNPNLCKTIDKVITQSMKADLNKGGFISINPMRDNQDAFSAASLSPPGDSLIQGNQNGDNQNQSYYIDAFNNNKKEVVIITDRIIGNNAENASGLIIYLDPNKNDISNPTGPTVNLLDVLLTKDESTIPNLKVDLIDTLALSRIISFQGKQYIITQPDLYDWKKPPSAGDDANLTYDISSQHNTDALKYDFRMTMFVHIYALHPTDVETQCLLLPEPLKSN